MRLLNLCSTTILITSIFINGCAKSPEEKQLKLSRDVIEIVLEGIIEPVQEAQIIAPTSEKLKSVYVKNGAKVAKGDVLAEYDVQELKFAYRKALVDHEKTYISSRFYRINRVENKEHLANAKERVLKTYELYKTDNASLSELKSAEDAYLNILNTEYNAINAYKKEEYQNAKARSEALKDVEKTRLDVERARYNLAHGQLVAGISGYVTDLKMLPGQSVGQGDLVGKIIDIDNLNLKGNFSPGIYRYLKIDMPLDISCLTTPPFKTKGRIKRISPVIDSKTKRMTIDIPLKNNNYLLQPEDKCLISINMSRKEAETAGIVTDDSKVFIKSGVK
ncbi:MAG: efflux RND transporter periplasmic adaptor subunit [Desulfuromonadales bacterium]